VNSIFHRSITVGALAIAVCAAPASAQRAAGPFSGILGAAPDADARHTLDVRASLFGAWDDNLTRSDDPALDDRFLRSGGAAGASASLVHARRSTRFQWSSSAGISTRLYGTDSDDRAATYSAQTGISTALSRRITLSMTGNLTYSPYYDFAANGDSRLANIGAFGGGFNVATAAERNLAAEVGSGLGFQLSRRDSISVNGGVTRHNFLDQANSAIDSWGAGATWRRTLTRSLSVRAGYGRQDATYRRPQSGPVTGGNFDFGIDFNDGLTFSFSPSRRTALSFGTSTSAMTWNDRTYFRLNGNATLAYSFGRSGSAALTFSRGTDFDAAFRDPVLSDVVSAGINNQLNRRMTWGALLTYQHGNIGFGSGTPTFDSYSAGGGVNIAVSRHFGFFTDYSLYRYEVPAGSTVFTSLSRFSRQSVTAGLSIWTPLIAK
jgi:hypothetical protein